MAKAVLAKEFVRAIIGGRRYSRGPTDATNPTAPDWAPNTVPVPNTTFVDLAWVNGTDGQTGIKETRVEYRLTAVGGAYTTVVVAYPLAAYQLTGLSSFTAYDVRLANVDNAGNVSSYSSVLTFSTLASSADLEPGAVSINATSATANEGAPLSIAITRTGAGVSAPALEVDWQFTGLAEGTPTPANGTLSFAAGTNSTELVQVTAGFVSVDRAGAFAIVAARALSGNIQPSIGTSQISVVINDVAASAGTKWHPGHYVKTQGQHASTSTAAYVTNVTNAITGYVNDSAFFLGALVTYAWGHLNPTGSTYDWSPVYTHITALGGKKLIVSLSWKCYNLPNRGVIAPADIISQSDANNQGGYTMHMETAAVMNRYIAFMEAFAAEFDDNPAVEMVTCDESAPSGTAALFPRAAWATQLLRLYPAMAAAFVKTNAMGMVNSLSGYVPTLIEALYQARMGRASPDAFDDSGSRVFRGEDEDATHPTTRDYRAAIPALHIGSAPSLAEGGKDYNGPPATMINWLQTQDATHQCWVLSLSSPATEAQIISAITADPLLHTACPTRYTACNVA